MIGDTSLLPPVYTATPDEVFINLLLYGSPGVGKTTFACQAQDHENMQDVLLCNIEGGTISIAHRGDITTVDIEDPQQLEAVFWELKKGEDGTFGSIQTVIIDSGTELQNIGLERIVQEEYEKALAKAGGVIDVSKRANIDDVWLEDYKRSGSQISRVFRYFRDLRCHCIVTALSREVYPPQSGGNRQAASMTPNQQPIEVRPGFTKSLASTITGFVDFVWYMFEDQDEGTEERQRYLLTHSNDIYYAKTRGPAFREAMGTYVLLKDLSDPKSEGFTLPDLYDLLRESK